MYQPKKIEPKWQNYWEKKKINRAKKFSKKPKQYILVEFPYPSGKGLHVGHCRSYVGLDILARKRRMEKFNVLFPMGWDAFGLPAENYAIKTGEHPIITTNRNTHFFKKQQQSLGISFDWSREINTTDPDYYKWTQWIFLQFFKHGLAYKEKMPINWCPSCKTGLANEEVIDGRCERCGTKVIQKEKEQWMLKITDYAEKLIEGLSHVDYPERVKTLQRDWIGKSEGYEVQFPIKEFSNTSINVFTTRLDTIFGATYLVIAPEHPIVDKIRCRISNQKKVDDYIGQSRKKLEKDRLTSEKEKTGVMIKGVTAINPANNQEVPVFISDYILMQYGTGAVMGVPAHDQRDLQFALRHNLSIIEVIKPSPGNSEAKKRLSLVVDNGRFQEAYSGEGTLINSGRFNGMQSQNAVKRIGEFLAKKKNAQKTVHYKLRDWVFSRQHYWGEPIPLIFCPHCQKKIKEGKNKKMFSRGELMNPGWIAVPEKDLPVKLPDVKSYKPTNTGESPLSEINSWVKTRCPRCGREAWRETDTMPNWAGSNWYYLRYCDPRRKTSLAAEKKLLKWMPVDWYNGGMEHTTLHLLYSRFVYKFLWDIKAVPRTIGSEPYLKRTSHGVILGEGGVKMSKSKGNVVNPEEVVNNYGADTLRLYEMFVGPFSEAIAWDDKGVKGMRRFLDRIWSLQDKVNQRVNVKTPAMRKLNKTLHKTIKKVSQDIDELKFNTAVSALMILVNDMESQEKIPSKYFSLFLTILSPFAPHIAEELWHLLWKKKKTIFSEKWPNYDPKILAENKFELVIQVNGRLRDRVEVDLTISKESAERTSQARPKIKKWLSGKKIKKIIFVPKKLINFVI